MQNSLPIKPKIAWSNESQTFSKQNEKDPIQILETGSLGVNFQSKVAFINQEIRANSLLSDAWTFVNEELKARLFSVIFYFSWVFDVFLAVMFVAGLTHIPHHNIVFEPKYWCMRILLLPVILGALLIPATRSYIFIMELVFQM